MDSQRDTVSPAGGGGSSLFDFSGVGDKSLSDIWAVPSGKAGSTQPRWPQPSLPASTSFSSQVPQHRIGATEQIRKSLAVLDEVVSAPTLTQHTHTPASTHPLRTHTPGSLLKESFRTVKSTPTPVAPPLTPSLSIMDETGLTRELLLAPFPDREDTAMERAQTPLSTTLYGHTTEDPTEKTSHDLVTSFHKTYSVHSSPAQSLELLVGLQQACDDQIAAVKQGALSSQLLAELVLERNTWELLSVLYSDRLEAETEDMNTIVLRGRSHREIADEYFVQESSVRQAQLVVDWLEKNAVPLLESYPVKVNYFADNVCWENTLHAVQRGTDAGAIVTELDPDAPRRQSRHLAELDEKDEQSLLKHLFTCVRAGQIAKAQELCVLCGQSWRAATLEGWKLHHDSNYGRNVLTDSLEPMEGNASRDLWKISAWTLSADASFSVYERALYAALSGNLRQILPACNSWLDYVWAYFKVKVDVLTEQRLRGFSPGLPLEPLPPDYWNAMSVPELIFQEIEASPNAVIVKQSKNPFHVVQKFIILENLEGLVSVMHDWLQKEPNLYQLRFMAHLVLFTQAQGRASSEESRCSEILQAYVKELIKEKFKKCVALYTSRLPRSQQVDCYATLLEDIVDPEDQRECLELGSQVGLDIALITRSVVEHVRNTGLDEAVTPPGPELVPQTDTEITKVDQSKIEVIHWLIYDKGQRSEAIKQGNALMRQFLATRKLTAASALFHKLPRDSVEVATRGWTGDRPLPADLANDIHEYLCIQAYLECHEAFNEWFHHFHHLKPEPPPEPTGAGFKDSVAYEHNLTQYQAEEQTWRTRLSTLTEDAEAHLYKVLLFDDSGWMIDPAVSEPVDERRVRQLGLLREICIPQTVFLLHTVLDSTHQTKKCLQLADIVASEQHQLYKVFRQHELERFLSLVHKTATGALTERQLEMGYPL